MIKNIIFDWSGTLSDDLTPAYNASMIMFKRLGHEGISLEEYKREFTLPYMKFWNKYFPKLSKAEENRLYGEAIYQVEEPKAYEGVRDVIERLNFLGINMIILSSQLQEKLELEVECYGLSGYFKVVHGDVHDKTEVIDEILKRNNFSLKQTVYVGDMTHDIEAGKKAGVKTIAIIWGYQDEVKLKKANPDYIINHIFELEHLL